MCSGICGPCRLDILRAEIVHIVVGASCPDISIIRYSLKLLFKLRRVELLMTLHLRATGCHLPWDHTVLPG